MSDIYIPRYTINEVSKIVGVPKSTVSDWTRKGSLITRTSSNDVGPSIPFVGLSEAFVLAAWRRVAKIPMQQIKEAVKILKNEFGLEHPLASKKLHTDGARILYDFTGSGEDESEMSKLIVVLDKQIVFSEVVRRFLKDIEYSPGKEGLAKVIRLPDYKQVKVVIDPERSYGDPIIDRLGIRVVDIVNRIKTQEPLAEIRDDYGLTDEEIDEVILEQFRAA